MRNSRRAIASGGGLILGLCLAAGNAAAQTPEGVGGVGISGPSRPERPYRGLFGGGVGTTTQKLTAEGSLGSGINQSTPTTQSISNPEAIRDTSGGQAPTVSGKLEYSLNRSRVGFDGTFSSYGDYDPAVGRMLSRHIGAGFITFSPFRATKIVFTESFKNVPEVGLTDLLGPAVAGEVIPLSQDVGLSVVRYTRVNSAVEASQRLGRRTKVDANYSWARGTVQSGLSWDILTYSATLTQNVSKGLGVHLGYRFAQQTFQKADGGTGADKNPMLDFGVDFGRPLSLTRRMRLSFSTGMTHLENRAQGASANQLIGSVALTREFGRTWGVTLSTGRNLQFVEAIATPLLAESVRVGVNGSFSHRLQFGAGFGAAKGQFGMVAQDSAAPGSGSRFDSLFGSARLSFALNRYVSMAGEYGYSGFSGRLPVTSHGLMYPHTARFYVQLWAPLFVRAER